MQSFSTTHCLRFVLRELYAWKRRRSSTKRYALLEDCHCLYSVRIRTAVNKINKNISWPTQRIEEVWGNLERHRGSQNSWHTSFYSRTAGYKSQRQGQEVDREVREPLAQGIFRSGLAPDAEDQQLQRKSKELIADMNNSEIFELCETSSKKQCTDCNWNWEIGIVYCTCGRCLKLSKRTKGFDKSNYDVSSIPGCV